MAHIVLIACASQKRATATRARDLYCSTLFRKSLAYADTLRPNEIFILSAKHGLVPQNEVLEPYDESLHDKSAAEVKDWAAQVLQALQGMADLRNDKFTVLAGKKYRRYLVPALANVEVPLEGLPGIGYQLERLGELLRK